MTTKRALVLAGGGVAGIAWETGVLRGIADESPETAEALLASDVVLGTSAGSTVGAQLGSGLRLDELFAHQVAQTSAEIDPGVGTDGLGELFLAAMTGPGSSAGEKLRRVGAVARSADTVTAPVRKEVIAARLPSHQWPARPLRITAIDIETGELVVFTADSGVDLVDAVAASCAVPGAWPPVQIGTRWYMDGGMRSSVNLDEAQDCNVAVVLVPAHETAPSVFGAGAGAEVRAFPGRAFGVFADDAALAAFGDNPLDPACRIPSARAGREQGRRAAAEVTEFLPG